MLLGIRLLNDVTSVNAYTYATQIQGYAGEARDVYVQLVDLEKHPPELGFEPPGLRYCPAAGATLTVDLLNLDAGKRVTKVATQPFPLDASIWKFAVAITDPVAGSVNVKLTLVESAVTRLAYAPAALAFTKIQTV